MGTGVEVTGYAHNVRGELLEVDLHAGGAVERVAYAYDPLGRRTARRAYDDEDTLLSTEKYLWNDMTELLAVYDGANQLQQRFDYLGGGLPVGVDTLLIGVTDGSRTWVIDRNDPATPGVSNSTGRVESISDGDLAVTPTYTPFGKIDTYTYEIDSTEYTWDLSVDIGGRIDGKAETLGVTASDYGYEYDEIGQLTEVVDHLDSDAVVEAYDYDANCNRIASIVDYGTAVTRTYAYNADDQLTSINGDEIEYGYDLFHAFIGRNLKPEIRHGRTQIYWADLLTAEFAIAFHPCPKPT